MTGLMRRRNAVWVAVVLLGVGLALWMARPPTGEAGGKRRPWWQPTVRRARHSPGPWGVPCQRGATPVGGVLAVTVVALVASAVGVAAWHTGDFGLSTAKSKVVATAHDAPPSHAGKGKPSSSGGAAVSASVCQPNELTVGATLAGPGAGGGTAVEVYAVRNTGSVTCTLEGFPTVVVVAPHQLSSPARQLPGTAEPVILWPGDQASFYLVVQTSCVSINPDRMKGATYPPPPTILKVTPPGSATAISMEEAAPLPCVDTHLSVSYFYPGIVFDNEQPRQEY